MGRYTGPVCRLCRREGVKLYLKGTRCDSPKCALERRPYAPGMQRARRGKLSDYGLRLREKQKVKRFYGIYERQFRRFFELARRQKGSTGDALLSLLERRLDNVVCRLGFAVNRRQARQMVTHGHILVNGRRVNIPSYLVRPGEVISIKTQGMRAQVVEQLKQGAPAVPSFLQRTSDDPPEGLMLRLPTREDVSIPVDVDKIVELLAR
jgi:small subunit ribosomal protein S4